MRATRMQASQGRAKRGTQVSKFAAGRKKQNEGQKAGYKKAIELYGYVDRA